LNARWELRPTVSLIRPHDGDTFPVGTPITVEATASDSDGFITQVQFFDGSIFAGGANPYLVTWTPSAPGGYWIYVTALDNDCQQGWSNWAYINVIE
jgi:chitinase